MKNIIATLIATAALSISTLAFAGQAMEVNRTAAASLESTGSVSVSGFTSPEDLNAALAAKATAAGASHYRITSVTGDNKISGTATLYH